MPIDRRLPQMLILLALAPLALGTNRPPAFAKASARLAAEGAASPVFSFAVKSE